MRTHSMPIPSVSDLQRIWSSLSVADRVAILGHAEEALSAQDSVRLMRVLAAVRTASQKRAKSR